MILKDSIRPVASHKQNTDDIRKCLDDTSWSFAAVDGCNECLFGSSRSGPMISMRESNRHRHLGLTSVKRHCGIQAASDLVKTAELVRTGENILNVTAS